MGTMVQSGRAENGGARSAFLAQGPYNPLTQMPRLRGDPTGADPAIDSSIIEYFTAESRAQDAMLLIRDRQIEYNLRMLLGQQWSQFSPLTGRYIDTSEWLTDPESSWRKMPVINKLLRYFMVTHSRMTEGQPILTFLPGPDRVDAELAQVMDTLVKKDWRDAGMEDVNDLLMMWLIIAGRAHAISRLDLTAGQWQPWIGSARLPIKGPDGAPVMDPNSGEPAMTPEPVDNVPFLPDGSPNAYFGLDGQVHHDGPPHMERSGGIAVDVYSPLQVRGQWGPQPWHRKRWHEVLRYLTPAEVYQAWGIEVEPDVSVTDAANIATLERVLFGGGFFTETLGLASQGWADPRTKGALCTVRERWEAPIPFDERLEGTWAEPLIETPDNPGGRHTVWTPKKLITDGPREAAWRFTSPVRCWDFVRIAGRPSGLTPLEMMLAPQRGYNYSRSQIEQQASLLGNPQIVVDSAFGVEADEFDNEPAHVYKGTMRPGVKPVQYLEVPPVSADVVKNIMYASQEIEEIGGLRGLEGAAPTGNASGDLVEELRFNADRLLGSTARRSPSEYARMADDWRLLYKRIYTAEMIVAINGEDNLAETLTVLPEVFKEGHVNIVPDAESMLPEGRGERQQRARELWQAGAFGLKDSMEARDIFLRISRFPNYAKLAKVGGQDREMAEFENGQFLMGMLDQPVLEWYDHMVHLTVHERYMKSPQFLKQPPIVQQAMAIHRVLHLQFLQKMMAGMAPPAGLPSGPPGGGGGAGPGPKGPPDKPLAPGAPRAPQSVAEAGGRSPTALNVPEV